MFPTCPSCKQSVLDDDAVDCPFCGASMKAKPGSAAKPPAAKPSPPKATAPATTAASTKPSSRPAKSDSSFSGSNSFDASPFDMGGDLDSGTPALSPAPSKSRRFEVKCPMCETVGYTTPDNAGKSVKCANPKCMIPVFTAPKPVAEKKAEPKPVKPKSNLIAVGGVTLAVMGVGGAIAWWVAAQPNKTQVKGPSEEDLALIKVSSDPAPANSTAKKTTAVPVAKPDAETEPAESKAAEAAEPSYAAILKTLNDSSLHRQNRSKPYSRRLSAEAFALTGDLKGARQQLEGLSKVGADVPYYQVTPLVQLAWQQLAKGQRKAAVKTVEEAWIAAQKLPTTGRDRLESVISLAAALVVVDRAADAQQLLDAHRTNESIAVLSQNIRTVQSLGTFDLAEMHDRRPAVSWNSPLTVGVIFDLVAHQQAKVARQWAEKLPAEHERAEAVGAWAEAVAWRLNLQKKSIPIADLRSAAEALPSPGNTLALSRLGLSLVWAGDEAAAQECLTRALAGISAWKPVSDVELPGDDKELSKFDPPDFAERSFQVAAAGEAVHLAVQLGQTEKADELLSTALARARASGPSPQVVQQRLQKTKAEGITGLRERLKQEWKLKTDEQARVAANTLQKSLDELLESAQRRVDLQARLLTEAVEWGLADNVWTYIRRGGTADDAAAADNLFFTQLPVLVAEKYQSAGNKEQHAAVAAAWKQLVPNRSLARPFAVLLNEAAASGAHTTAQQVQLLKQFPGESQDLDGLVLRAACRQAAAGRFESALTFAARLDDPVLREECYLLIGGIAGRRSDTKVVEKHFAELTQASEKVALGRGLIAGWVAGKPSKPAPAADG